MHIAFLCNEYPPYKHGGMGSFVQIMARRLVQSGHQVTVVGLYLHYRGLIESDDHGVRVYRLPAKGGLPVHPLQNYWYLGQFLRQLHRQCPVDILEGNELGFALLPFRLPGRQIIRMQGGHQFFAATLGLRPRPFLRLLENLSFARADHFCAVSQFAADTTRHLLKLGQKPIVILPNPVDTELFRPFTEIIPQPGLIIFTGGLREKKGIRQLIQAMPAIIEKCATAQLWIHGGDTHHPQTGQSFLDILKKEITPLVADHIHFRGIVAHESLPQINAQAELLVYPSWMETQGIVVIEGMAGQKAVLASQTGPGPELITPGVDGLLCDPYDPASIAEQAIRVLGDPTLSRELGFKARHKAVTQFSIATLLEKNLCFYHSCLNSLI